VQYQPGKGKKGNTMSYMNYFTPTTTVAGYSWQADIWCPAHALSGIMGAEIRVGDPVSAIARIAERRAFAGLETEDSAVFPIAFSEEEAHDGCHIGNDYLPGQCQSNCTVCGYPVSDCPNEEVPQDYLDDFTEYYARMMLDVNTTEIRRGCDGSQCDPNEPGECGGHGASASSWHPASASSWHAPGAFWGLEAFTAASRADIEQDCRDFVRGQWHLLRDLDPQESGENFALSRNGHGTGFFDHVPGHAGNQLQEASRPYGESNAYYFDGESNVRLDDERAESEYGTESEQS